MTYVIADAHGHYEKYKRLLHKIDLQPCDTGQP